MLHHTGGDGGPYLAGIWDGKVAWDLSAHRTDALLVLNEPDSCVDGGVCVTVEEAVPIYQKYMNKYGGKAQLGAPGVTNGPAGLPWLKNFMNKCSDCQIDFVVAHWYGYYSEGIVPEFTNYIDEFIATFNKPVWLTEFSLRSGTNEQQQEFLKAALEYLDKNKMVHLYAYYMATPSPINGAAGLVNADGSLTAIGEIYDRYPEECTNFFCT